MNSTARAQSKRQRGLFSCLFNTAIPGLLTVFLPVANRAYEGPTDGSFTLQGNPTHYTTVRPDAPGYDAGWKERINLLVNAKSWDYTNCNWGDKDAGKRAWSQLLAEMYKVIDNPSQLQNWINLDGNEVLTNAYGNTSTFYKPFSCPGYSLYYFRFKDKLPQTQIDAAKSMVNSSGFKDMSRPDGYMDPIYTKTEKNSENFNWMARLSGYLWANELNNSTYKSFFSDYLNNWTRALFNTGRVEWNSNVYFGYCWNPCMVLFEFAQTEKAKLQAKAALDWQIIDLALHYIDGTTTGPDIRAKEKSYKNFPGTSWLYSYLYFGDEQPSYSKSKAQESMASISAMGQMCGFPAYSSYRPPQVALDIAHRKYKTPIEIHSAKPFYQADYEEYRHWKGDHNLSRRFDFETLYLEKNYTLASIASNIPSGIDCFWEVSLWKMAVTGNSNGAIQIFGNAGGFSNSHLSAGRSPYEQIGQYRNCMMRLIKGTSELWTAFPASIAVQWNGNIAFADMGHGVYVALMPENETGKSETVYSTDNTYNKCAWSFNSNDLGALVLEAGTVDEHGSYANFKSAILSKSTFSSPASNQIEFTASSGRKLRMEFMPLLNSYTYWHNKPGQPALQKTISPAGVTPKVWCDNEFLDFSNWQSWHVSSGENIVEQNWGSGALTATVGGKGIQIVVNPATAEVQYRNVDLLTDSKISETSRKHSAPFHFKRVGNTIHLTNPLLQEARLEIVNCAGQIVTSVPLMPGDKNISLPASASSGFSVVRLTYKYTSETNTLISRK